MNAPTEKAGVKGKIATPLLNQVMILALAYKSQLKGMLKELNEECPPQSE